MDLHNNFDGRNLAANFGYDFNWGVSISAWQNEGAILEDGKSLSIWDDFINRKKNSLNHPIEANSFYKDHRQHIELLSDMNFNCFRFSTAWSRILPSYNQTVNSKGLDFYHRLIDDLLEKNIKPFITCYHWDLPLWLQERGGWQNRDIISYFGHFVQILIKFYGDRVKDWFILNEPLLFSAAGHMLGVHAPGKTGVRNFLPAAHHALLAQHEAAAIFRSQAPDARIGSAFSQTVVIAKNQKPANLRAAERGTALLNDIFVNPTLGLGYPIKVLPFLNRIEKYALPGDEELLKTDLDFIGIQNYTRFMVKNAPLIPYVKAFPVLKRKVKYNALKWEVYPSSVAQSVKRLAAKTQLPIIVSECGIPWEDELINGEINDQYRIDYYKNVLTELNKIKNEGTNLEGFFAWTLIDNIEWAEGMRPRFGLVYYNFQNKTPILKKSGKWFKKLLSKVTEENLQD